jgi:hypothetical protein
MMKRKKIKLYDLTLEAGSSCFQFFSPEIYTEVRGYQNNPAFQDPSTHSLLSIANQALVFFTRSESSYETDLKKRYSYISEKNKKKATYKGLGFNADHFRAFKKPRSDFEEAATLCLKTLNDQLDADELKSPQDERNGYNDSHLLDACFRNELFESKVMLKTSSGCAYHRSHLLGAFSLWKLDRTLAAISQNKASDVANLIADIHTALNIAQGEYSSEIKALNERKKKSELKAEIGRKRHKNLEPLKAEAIEIYKGKQWASVKKAAEYIYKELNLSSHLSGEEGVKTISGWLTKADPQGKFSKYKRKKATG